MIRVVRLARPLYGLQSSFFSRALIAAAREIPGMRWNAEEKAWVGYPDAIWATIQLLIRQNIVVDNRPLPDPFNYGTPLIPVAEKNLRDYQKEGVRFAMACAPTGALLAFDMGLGKSCVAATAARAWKNKTLIVCPAHVRGVWAHFDESKERPGELQKWWPDARLVCVPEGVTQVTPLRKPSKADPIFRPKENDTRYPSVMQAARVVVIHYDIVHAWVDTLIAWGFRTLILDEAHLGIQSARSRRSEAIRKLRAHASAVMALTGTPPADRPKDLWNLVDTLSPGRVGQFFDYGRRYCAGHLEEVAKNKPVWKFDGQSNLDELKARVSYFTLRRTTANVRLELPKLTQQVIRLPVKERNRIAITSNILKSKRAMREALNLAADGKMKDAIAAIGDDAAAGNRVIAFTWRRHVAERIANAMARRGIPSDVIMGGVSEQNRRIFIDMARLRTSHVMACTINATSTGIDLSYANMAMFVELTWEPDEIAQAIKRLHRFGQLSPVLIKFLIANGTGDELVLDAVISKLDTFETIFSKTELDIREKREVGLQALAARLLAKGE